MSRKVLIASAKTNTAIRVEGFTGTTFADLKVNPQFSAIYNNGDGVEVVVKPGNISLRGDDSILPTGDFSAYIIPTKNKAGISTSDAKEISNTIYTAIIQGAQRANQEQKETLKNNLRAAVQNAFSSNPNQRVVVTETPVAPAPPVDDELMAALREAQNM